MLLLNIELIEIFLGSFHWCDHFYGFYCSLWEAHGLISSKALSLPGKHKLNLLAIIATVVLMVLFV